MGGDVSALTIELPGLPRYVLFLGCNLRLDAHCIFSGGRLSALHCQGARVDIYYCPCHIFLILALDRWHCSVSISHKKQNFFRIAEQKLGGGFTKIGLAIYFSNTFFTDGFFYGLMVYSVLSFLQL